MLAPLATLATLGYTSKLLGTSWRIKLSVGLEPGSWMPKTVEGWGASGGRLLVDALVDFDDSPAPESEELVGPQAQTRILTARGGSKYVTLDGEQEVSFTSGGWCVQRPLFSDASSNEGLLRFWLDCPSGFAKNDVSVPPGERIFFSTGVWDEADGLKQIVADRTKVEEQLEELEAEEQKDADGSGYPSFLPGAAFRRNIRRQEARGFLTQRRRYIESFTTGLADTTDADADADADAPLMATDGSLSLKRSRGGGFLGGTATEYHILGSFAAQRVLDGAPAQTSGAVS